MSSIYPWLRRLLFSVDAERAHRLALEALRLGEAMAGWAPDPEPHRWPHLRQRLLAREFPHPIGLAAGFDKDGVAPHVWGRLGFGFAEIGTVTGRAQPGNPSPRLFRLPADRAVINRLGFNSAGAATVATRLERRLRRRPAIPIGINIGCSRAVIGDADAEIADYQESVRALARFGDYLAVNVSSPNTPGLRDLQAPERLARLVQAIRSELDGGAAVGLPVLVKLAPDLADDTVSDVCQAAVAAGAAGLIAGNTTLSRAGCTHPAAAEVGGLSGAPLRQRATDLVALVRRAVGPEPVVVGAGGVSSIADVREKLEAGADLVALYTALVYEGPFLPRRLADGLEKEVAAGGGFLVDRRERMRHDRASAPAAGPILARPTTDV